MNKSTECINIIEYSRPKPNISLTVLKYLPKNKWFLTGSFRYGKPNKYSDIDIAMPIDEKKNFIEKFPYALEPSDYNEGLKYGIYNFIFLHPVSFVSWFKAASMLEVMDIKTNNKVLRLAIHEMVSAAVKASLSDRTVDKDNYLQFCNIEEINNGL